MRLESSAFVDGGEMPRRCTRFGADLSPELKWRDVPPEAAALALIVEDPDAPSGTWLHWLVVNIPVEPGRIPQAVPRVQNLPSGAKQGRNDYGHIGYGGPCPPPGPAHRYIFRLLALARPLHMSPRAERATLRAALDGTVLAEARLVGRFARPPDQPLTEPRRPRRRTP